LALARANAERGSEAETCARGWPELVGNIHRQILHGGVISAVLDVAAGFAVYLAVNKDRMANPGVSRFPEIGTIDLRVGYLRPGRGKYFIATGRVVCSAPVSRSRTPRWRTMRAS
jgi:acyl-coenzyme A thioesterase PaaI-like protein